MGPVSISELLFCGRLRLTICAGCDLFRGGLREFCKYFCVALEGSRQRLTSLYYSSSYQTVLRHSWDLRCNEGRGVCTALGVTSTRHKLLKTFGKAWTIVMFGILKWTTWVSYCSSDSFYAVIQEARSSRPLGLAWRLGYWARLTFCNYDELVAFARYRIFGL